MKTHLQALVVEKVDNYPQLRIVESQHSESSSKPSAASPKFKAVEIVRSPRAELDALGWKPRAERLGRGRH